MTAADEDLLAGIPLVTPPERRILQEAESAAELHAGITVTAERLRSAAFTIPAPEDTSGAAWRRKATAAAIVCDIASLALHTLAMRATRLSNCPADPARLAACALELADARNAWEQAAGMWRIMTTDTQSGVNAMTADTADLVVRMGRLVFANPAWTPAKEHQARRRPRRYWRPPPATSSRFSTQSTRPPMPWPAWPRLTCGPSG
jgi:hypothetical protein